MPNDLKTAACAAWNVGEAAMEKLLEATLHRQNLTTFVIFNKKYKLAPIESVDGAIAAASNVIRYST
ncbi:hypothetical protein SAMN05216369_0643 [Marinobacter antarcticus]|uniref:Uncharacterized protein n=1 Tax=Marinobacter antarcticus TaxID=564117 RepID=A0A1M6Q1M5_9GAMM|nr:hypothetical protein [Marinobacter antarcticus]SHK14109.1 hypothetical protein SAMN05216369_0643 [Marinobacter antarcticus]